MKRPLFFLALLLSYVLVSFWKLPFPQVPPANGLYENITYNSSDNVVTFNQNSSTLYSDWYYADLGGTLTVFNSTTKLRVLNYNATGSSYTDLTNQANNDTIDDVKLIPNKPVAVNDAIYIGSTERRFNKVWFNMTTAGNYTSTITWYYSKASGWNVLSFSQSPNPIFKSTGLGKGSFTPNTVLWQKQTVNGTNAYWIMGKITSAGTVTTQPLAKRIWLNYDSNVPVRPADSNELKLDIVTTDYVSNGSVGIDGIDFDGNLISEKLSVTSAGTYTTTKKYAELSYYGVNASGSFTFSIHQNRWGSIAYGFYGDDRVQTGYTQLSGLQVGNGSSHIQVSDSLKQIYLNPYPDTEQTYAILVKNNSALTFGVLIDETTKGVKDGVEILSEYPTLIYGEPLSTVYLYSFSVAVTYTYGGTLYFFGESRVYGVSSNVAIVGKDLDVYNYMAMGTWIPFPNSQYTLTGTFEKYVTYGAQAVISISNSMDEDLTITNLFARNYTKLLTSTLPSTYNIYLINPDVDLWKLQFASGSTTQLYRKYDLTLKVTYENGTAFNGANVTLTNQAGTVGTWLTNSTGQIPKQQLTRGLYNYTGGNTMYDNAPFTLKITSTYGNYTQVWTPIKADDWLIALTQATESEFPEGLFMGAILIGVVALVGVLAVKRRS